MQTCWSCLLVLEQLNQLENCYGDSKGSSKSENIFQIIVELKVKMMQMEKYLNSNNSMATSDLQW